ncbi:hypothetical protein KSP40_PGU010480 [Platanthera guangdongensis]|uniref:Uncharacterized protein n=1 Tax=Platanthera guangdongensis TaxID=2320717 RepID=A0ABR2LKJ9_9ASPA
MTAMELIAAGNTKTSKNPLPRRACFSFAAYAKAVIDHLQSGGVPVASGLSDAEFNEIESAHGFHFPPDLHSILREGLPVGAGFPNWRLASPQQIQILLSLPISGLIYEISSGSPLIWPAALGPRPESHSKCISLARSILAGAPKLIPIYRHFYITATSNIAGNPIFYVRGKDVRCCGFDLADFFYREEVAFLPAARLPAPAPSWAATEARRVEVWTDLSAGCGGDIGVGTWMKVLEWRLREAGWREKEVKEMLLMGESDGVDQVGTRTKVKDRLDLLRHVRTLALVLLRGGWSAEDVVYSLGGSGGDGLRSPPGTWQVDTTANEISLNF